MKVRFDPGTLARMTLFATLPWLCTVAVLGVASFVSVAGFLSFRASLVRQALEKRPLALCILTAFALWAAASCLWSPYPNHIQAPKLLLTLAGGLLFAGAASRDRNTRRLTFAAGLAAFTVLALLLGIEAAWTRPLNHTLHPDLDIGTLDTTTGRATSVLVLMTWAAAGGLLSWGRRSVLRVTATAALIAASGALSMQFAQLSNAAAFGFGLIAFAGGFLAPRLAVLVVSGGVAAWALAAPFLTPALLTSQRLVDALPTSAAARVEIWRYVAQRIPERFWFGHGLDASRLPTPMLPVRGDYSVAAIPLHPHSASMQIWFETGAVGAVLAASALLVGGWSLSRRFADDRPSAAAAAATIAAIGVIANVSYGIWQEWWDAAMLLAAALVASVSARSNAAPGVKS